jgi:SAM-dependent methyltransferase
VDCETLCSAHLPDAPELVAEGGEPDLHRPDSFGRFAEKRDFPRVEEMARRELAERSPYWLLALLRRKSSPGRVLEVGCGHGGFVALLRAAGFDATGLEPSPGLAEDARRRFDIPVLAGTLESQQIAPGSLDAVVLMDAMERFRNPVERVRNCLALLKSDGIFLIQTPRYREALPFRTMQRMADPFLQHLKHERNLYLFSQSSIELFFRRLGVAHVEFEPDMFCHHNMLLAAGRTALASFSDEQIATVLTARPSRRMALALIDIDDLRRHGPAPAGEFVRKATPDPLERAIARMRDSLVFRVMRMFGLWEWLENGFDSATPEKETPGGTGHPSQDVRQRQPRGD